MHIPNIPVSYTHLDVYKRQEHFRVDNINSEPYLDNKLNIVVNIDFYKGR